MDLVEIPVAGVAEIDRLVLEMREGPHGTIAAVRGQVPSDSADKLRLPTLRRPWASYGWLRALLRDKLHTFLLFAASQSKALKYDYL